MILKKNNLVIYIDKELLQEDMDYIINYTHLNVRKANGYRTIVESLTNTIQLVDTITDDIFDKIPLKKNGCFSKKNVILKTTEIEASRNNHVCLVLRQRGSNECSSEIRLVVAADKPSYIKDVLDATEKIKDRVKAIPIQNLIAGHIYLDKLGEKKYLYLGKVRTDIMYYTKNAAIVYGDIDDMYKNTSILDCPIVHLKQLIQTGIYTTKNAIYSYVFLDINESNIKKYGLSNNTTLNKVRQKYVRSRKAYCSTQTKKIDFIRNSILYCYNRFDFIVSCQKTVIKDLGEIKEDKSDLMILEGNSKGIDFIAYALWL